MRSPSRKGSALQPESRVGSRCWAFGETPLASARFGRDPSTVGAGRAACDLGGTELELPAARIRSQHFDSAGGIADGFAH